MGSEATGSFHVNSYTISNNKQEADFSSHSSSGLSICQVETLETHTNNVDTSVWNNRSSSMPSGIGLHLNSIVANCGSNTQLARKVSFNSSREKILSGNKQPMLEHSEGWLVEYEKQTPISQDAYRLEEFNQRRTEKKRWVCTLIPLNWHFTSLYSVCAAKLHGFEVPGTEIITRSRMGAANVAIVGKQNA